MDQVKIGQFIALLRKEKGLTQKQLADELFISEKTVSKWECGKGLPDVSLMLPLCALLGISVNELLLGERVEEREYKRVAEENLVQLVGENKRKHRLFITCGALTIISVSSLLMLASLVETSVWVRIILIVCAVFVGVKGLVTSARLELEAGHYECPKCHKLFKPTMSEYVKGAHTLTRRKLKCPSCGEKGYCKYVFAAKVGNEIKKLDKEYKI